MKLQYSKLILWNYFISWGSLFVIIYWFMGEITLCGASLTHNTSKTSHLYQFVEIHDIFVGELDP